jgi:hypothetical protein
MLHVLFQYIERDDKYNFFNLRERDCLMNSIFMIGERYENCQKGIYDYFGIIKTKAFFIPHGIVSIKAKQ